MSEKERHFAVFQKKTFLDRYFLILNLFSIWFSSKHKVMTEVKIINVILLVQFFIYIRITQMPCPKVL